MPSLHIQHVSIFASFPPFISDVRESPITSALEESKLSIFVFTKLKNNLEGLFDPISSDIKLFSIYEFVF